MYRSSPSASAAAATATPPAPPSRLPSPTPAPRCWRPLAKPSKHPPDSPTPPESLLMTSTTPETRFTVRDLPFAARLTLTLFLVSVGIGYCSALVQLHFQHAKAGRMLPDGADAVNKFHGAVGENPVSQIEQLIFADEQREKNGTGQMSAAFFRWSENWKQD